MVVETPPETVVAPSAGVDHLGDGIEPLFGLLLKDH